MNICCFCFISIIVALSPPSLNQDEEESADVEHEIQFVPTIPPITKTTTLRTIIKPDSEVFHSNSGIHVTFNTEDKHQSGHELQENIEGSELQPVISDDRGQFENFVRPAAQYQQHESQQQHQHQQHQQQISHSDHRSRTFDALGQFNRLQNRINPQNSQNPPSGIYRPTPDQGLLLSYTNNQQNRYFQSQNYDSRLKNSPPVPFFPEPSSNQLPQQHHQTNKFRQQPKPIPIPLRHSEQQELKPIPHNGPHPQQQYFKNGHNQQQFNKPGPGPLIKYQQPQYRLKPEPPFTQSQFVQSQPGPVQSTKPVQSEQHRFGPVPNFNPSQTQFTPNNGLFQQRAPNLAQPPNVVQQQSNVAQQTSHNQNIPAQFNRLVTGAELVEAVPKFEQHITETVALSEINKPFGRSPPQNTQPSQLTVAFNNIYQQQQKPSQAQPHQQQTQIHIQQSQQSQQLHQQQQQQQTNRIQQSHPQAIHHQQHQASVQQHQNSPQLVQSQRQHQQITQQSIQHQQIHQQQHQQSKSPQIQHQAPQQQHISSQSQHSQEPQIVLPINYHSQSSYPTHHQQQQQQQQHHRYHTNIQNNQNVAQPNVVSLQDKIIPGKGVSTLATDVFATLEKSQNAYKIQTNKYADISSRNNVDSSAGPIKSLVSSKPDHITITAETSRAPSSTTAKPISHKITAQLPDEVPDDLRQQLLSSGILENADISILDYDKVGDIPLESLPPEHLANFYGAGGATQISSSNRVLNIVKPNGENVANIQYDDGDKSDDKKVKTLPKKQNVDLKVVRFDSNSQKDVANEYIKEDSQVVPSVDINRPYNRYLPLKINGEHFPIPDVESLRNKKISSVVVLAPVDGLHSADDESDSDIEDGRFERDIINSKEIKFISGDTLKSLLKKPTKEHFKKWLEKEAKTDIDLQSVVLLVST